MTNPTNPADGEVVTHDSAMQSARKFIDYFFGNEGPKPRASIPADLSHDDDLILTRYIAQQRTKDSQTDEAQQSTDTVVKDCRADNEKGIGFFMYEKAPPLPSDTEMLDWCQNNLQQVLQFADGSYWIDYLDTEGAPRDGGGGSLRDAIRKAMATTGSKLCP